MAFSKILIANRAEIACRIVRTARALGYRTVAVYSDADADGLHAEVADEAVRIGPPPVSDSYLNGAALLEAAKRAGADAVHPGYGFLSENEGFAQSCEQVGLVFIGPTPAAIRAMGNKAAAKRLMLAAGLPCVPGYQGEEQSDQRLATEADRIGFPVMVKAAAGGGGRGMRLVEKADDLAHALADARSEAASAFGSAELILERAVADARHVEIQVFADTHGNIVHLGERDCSVQRRHQKVIEEAPGPAVSAGLRAQMGEAAVAAARAIGYRGAGTVEFLLDPEGHFFFLEMNTRLQVEHAVTEAITGLDLVEWQLRVAAGERLPLEQHEVTFSGHAIEARLYAEDPYQGFLPQSGTVTAWRPATAAGLRIDHGLRSGQVISPYYDPLLAKLIAHGSSREEARHRLIAALENTVVFGIQTNRAFLAAMLRHPAFIAGHASTSFIGKHFSAASPHMRRPQPEAGTLALAAVLLFEASKLQTAPLLANWRSSGTAAWPMRLAVGDTLHTARVLPGDRGRYTVSLDSAEIKVDLIARQEGTARIAVDGLEKTVRFAFHDGLLQLEIGGSTTSSIRDTLYDAPRAGEQDGDGRLLAPMNGRIVTVLARPGDKVAKGQRLVVLEAMKMQHEVTAGRDGTIEVVAVKEGDQVATRQLLVALSEG